MNPVLVVTSRARSDLLMRRGLTLDWLTHSKKYEVILAIREDEKEAYMPVLEKYPTVRLMLLPRSCTDSGMYRDAILRHELLNGIEKVAICDDDLTFSYRDWSGFSLPRLPKERIDEAFDALFTEIDNKTIHVGLRHRAFAQACTNKVDEFKRILWVHGVNRRVVIENDFRFAWQCKVMVDFHFQLSVIRAGFRTAVVNSYIADDSVGPYKNNGGCNIYRTNDERTKAAYALEAMFPEAVTIRYKETPLGNCADVTVKFSKARQV